MGDWDGHTHIAMYRQIIIYKITGNSTQYSVMTCMRKESKNEWIYGYVYLIHFAVEQKLKYHRSIILQ